MSSLKGHQPYKTDPMHAVCSFNLLEGKDFLIGMGYSRQAVCGVDLHTTQGQPVHAGPACTFRANLYMQGQPVIVNSRRDCAVVALSHLAAMTYWRDHLNRFIASKSERRSFALVINSNSLMIRRRRFAPDMANK